MMDRSLVLNQYNLTSYKLLLYGYDHMRDDIPEGHGALLKTFKKLTCSKSTPYREVPVLTGTAKFPFFRGNFQNSKLVMHHVF